MVNGKEGFQNRNKRHSRSFGQGGGNRNFQRNGNRPFFKPHHKPFIPHVCFDFIQSESAFQRVKPEKEEDNTLLNEILVKRSQDLMPTPTEHDHLVSIMTEVQKILDGLVSAPGDFDGCQIDEVKQIGSLMKGTMLMSDKLVGDICVVLKTLPTREAVNRLATKVFEDIKTTIKNPLVLQGLNCSINENGFEILSPAKISVSGVDVAVQVYITTQHQNLRRLDSNIHLEFKTCQMSLSSVKHAKWFEENASSEESIKILIRLLKDVRNRFDGLNPLNPWLIDLLAHYAIMNNPKNEPLNLVAAFKRVFQLLSSGFFLPGSAGIIDPCEQPLNRVHTCLNLEQQDLLCYTTQTLLRVMSHGGFNQIVGLEGRSSIATNPSVWAGVEVVPSGPAYEPPKENEEANDENMDDSGAGVAESLDEQENKNQNTEQIEAS